MAKEEIKKERKKDDKYAALRSKKAETETKK